ncbi:VAMP-associated protein [Aulographum hederae CBS 113979]|uniref:VAMP-associated protein n=1 Tax=Aulographum hederae CBS 113979 TaxID=1176131 RepID=A0A6G1H474_9PEZI|nr:VAMP-associated protein [Aulographum hederae CBS 113979]
MSVELDPVELGFRRPFTQEVAEVLRLKNPHSDPVAFKVKTTAPKQYCVRPNSGRIEPGKEVSVQVLLQAMKEDPAPDAKCRDKFLVQSVAITADKEGDNVAAIWSLIEQTARSSIQEKKIRVIFLPANANAAVSTPQPQSGAVNGIAHGDGSQTHRSPSPEAVTPQTSTKITDLPSDAVSSRVARESASNPAMQQSTLGAAATTVSNALPSSDDLKAQLAEAKAQIAKLQQQASEGLRQRKVGGSDEKGGLGSANTSMGIQQAQAAGVPVQMAAILCLISFLLAYFFF